MMTIVFTILSFAVGYYWCLATEEVKRDREHTERG